MMTGPVFRIFLKKSMALESVARKPVIHVGIPSSSQAMKDTEFSVCHFSCKYQTSLGKALSRVLKVSLRSDPCYEAEQMMPLREDRRVILQPLLTP